MERAEFNRIDKYIEDIEENLERQGTQHIVTGRQLTKLHLVIERLIHLSEDTKNLQLKSSLTTLEHRARRCMSSIQARHTVSN